MPNLSEEYGIEHDSRYATCAKEALFSFGIFLLAAVGGVGAMFALTVGRTPEQYGTVLGWPSYLFWGIVVVDFGFVLVLLLGQRFLFRDVSLEPADPASGTEERPTGLENR